MMGKHLAVKTVERKDLQWAELWERLLAVKMVELSVEQSVDWKVGWMDQRSGEW